MQPQVTSLLSNILCRKTLLEGSILKVELGRLAYSLLQYPCRFVH
jgi:hypothetical protein